VLKRIIILAKKSENGYWFRALKKYLRTFLSVKYDFKLKKSYISVLKQKIRTGNVKII
jgi:hypothetical protein